MTNPAFSVILFVIILFSSGRIVMITKKKLKTFLLMTVGCISLAVGVYFFKIPNGFTTGGVTGIAMILGVALSFLPITTSMWIIILNVVLLVLGFLILGKKTIAKTVYCSLLYSGLTFVFERFMPMTEPFTDSPFLELVYAIILTAIGSALIFNVGGSSGGTDIVALILKKYSSLDVGKALLVVDFVVAASSFFFFGIKAGLFSLLGLFAKAFVVDSMIESFYVCKYFVVITSKKDEIAAHVMQNLGHGVTVNSVVGEYTHEEKAMIHTVCKRHEAIAHRAKIKQIDPDAFIIVTTSSEIIGRGFRGV